MSLNRIRLNPKALDLDSIIGMNKKVTLGFRCAPEFKVELAKMAYSEGLTLSAYVENILLNYSAALSTLQSVLNELKAENKALCDKVKFYESGKLKKMFEMYRGRKVLYNGTDGVKTEISVDRIEDVYTIMVNSFK